MVAGGDGILREFGKAMYTVTHCPYSNGSPTRTYIPLQGTLLMLCTAWMGGDWRENGYSYPGMAGSLHCSPEEPQHGLIS